MKAKKKMAVKKMVKAVKKSPMGRKASPKKAKGKAKVEKVMREYKRGDLHSGSKKGPTVTKKKQAIAIALSEARKKGAKIPKKKGKKA